MYAYVDMHGNTSEKINSVQGSVKLSIGIKMCICERSRDRNEEIKSKGKAS